MNVALYARVSSDRQDTDLSISAQLKALREWASRNGHVVVKEYVDEAESGRSMERPGFQEMVATARQKRSPFEAIAVWKLSRFARSRESSVVFKKLLRKHGVQVVSITEPFEDTPTGRLLEAIIESLDEFYSANLGQEVVRGMRESASRGFYVSSGAPYGYRRLKVKDGSKNRTTLEVHPEHAAVVARMFREARLGAGLKAIAKGLNDDGIPNPHGKRWGKSGVYWLLTNEAYAGTLVWGRNSKGGKEVPPVRVENAWEAIVDRATFDGVQATLREKAPSRMAPRRASSRYLLSGLAVCGSCGRALVAQEAKSGKYCYYQCGTLMKQGSGSCGARYLNKEKFEGLVIEKLKERILTEENLRELVKMVNEEMDSTTSETRGRLGAVVAEVSDVRRRLDKLYDALETGSLTMADLGPRIQSLRHREDQLQAAMVDLEGQLAQRRVELADGGTVRAYAENLRDVLSNSPLLEQRAFIRSFVKEIRVTGNEAVLTYCLPLPPDGVVQESAEVLDIVQGGRAHRTRTCNPLIKSQLLCQIELAPHSGHSATF